MNTSTDTKLTPYGRQEIRDETLRKENDELKEKLSDLRFSVSMKASQYKDEIPAPLYDSLFELTRKYKE